MKIRKKIICTIQSNVNGNSYQIMYEMDSVTRIGVYYAESMIMSEMDEEKQTFKTVTDVLESVIKLIYPQP